MDIKPARVTEKNPGRRQEWVEIGMHFWPSGTSDIFRSHQFRGPWNGRRRRVPTLACFILILFASSRGNDGNLDQCESWPDLSLSSQFPDPVSTYVPSLIFLFLLPFLSISLFHNSLFTDTSKVRRFSWERGGDPSPRASLPRVPGLRPRVQLKHVQKKKLPRDV